MERHVPKIGRQLPAKGAKRPAPVAGAAADPRTRRLLELQRTVGNAAVVQLLGDQEDAGSDDLAEDAASTGPVAKSEIARFEFEAGENYYRAGQYAHAYDSYAKAYEYDPRPGLLYDMAQALRRLGGRREEAAGLYQRYLATGDTAASSQAQAHLDELKTPESAGDQQLDTAQAQALFAKGEAAFKAGDFGHAYDYYGQAYALDPKADLVFDQAQALKRLGGRLDETIALYERYLGLEGATATDRARKILDDLRTPEASGDQAEDTPKAQALFTKGEAAYRSGDYAHAYDYYGQAHELDARPALLYDQAQALRRLGGRSADAISLYQQYLDSGDTAVRHQAQAHLGALQAHGAWPEGWSG